MGVSFMMSPTAHGGRRRCHTLTKDGAVSGPEPIDVAGQALADLVGELEVVTHELANARSRALELQEQRGQGRSWYTIVAAEDRPLIVEQLSSALASLSTAGSAWRRAQAHALQDEGVSINRIAALYGVTRQRVTALLRDREDDSADDG
jgi:hypothetical protein